MAVIELPVTPAPAPATSGPGACCVEAQADGVPCSEIRDCAVCGRAHPAPACEPVKQPAR